MTTQRNVAKVPTWYPHLASCKTVLDCCSYPAYQSFTLIPRQAVEQTYALIPKAVQFSRKEGCNCQCCRTINSPIPCRAVFFCEVKSAHSRKLGFNISDGPKEYELTKPTKPLTLFSWFAVPCHGCFNSIDPNGLHVTMYKIWFQGVCFLLLLHGVCGTR